MHKIPDPSPNFALTKKSNEFLYSHRTNMTDKSYLKELEMLDTDFVLLPPLYRQRLHYAFTQGTHSFEKLC